MSDRGRRRPYAKGAERREKIIQTATDVFAEEGFEGAALKHVAELVGVREATLFHYFASKQELLTAVLEERDRRSLELAEGGLTLENMPLVARNNEKQPGLTTLYAVASATANHPNHDSHEYFRQRYEQVVGDIGADVALAQAEGRIRQDLTPELAARLAVALFDGIQLQWLYDKQVDMAEALKTFIDVLLKTPADHAS